MSGFITLWPPFVNKKSAPLLNGIKHRSNKVLNESCFVNNLLKQKAYKGLYLFICWRFKKMGIVFWFGGFGL
jgi:hypothetical protein